MKGHTIELRLKGTPEVHYFDGSLDETALDSNVDAQADFTLRPRGPLSTTYPVRFAFTLAVTPVALRFPTRAADVTSSSTPTNIHLESPRTALMAQLQYWDYSRGENKSPLPVQLQAGLSFLKFTKDPIEINFLAGATRGAAVRRGRDGVDALGRRLLRARVHGHALERAARHGESPTCSSCSRRTNRSGGGIMMAVLRRHTRSPAQRAVPPWRGHHFDRRGSCSNAQASGAVSIARYQRLRHASGPIAPHAVATMARRANDRQPKNSSHEAQPPPSSACRSVRNRPVAHSR